MKNRSKSSLEACWALLGPLACLIGILEGLGNVFGASWERLGASWGRPGGIPEPEGDSTWTPEWVQDLEGRLIGGRRPTCARLQANVSEVED